MKNLKAFAMELNELLNTKDDAEYLALLEKLEHQARLYFLGSIKLEDNKRAVMAREEILQTFENLNKHRTQTIEEEVQE